MHDTYLFSLLAYIVQIVKLKNEIANCVHMSEKNCSHQNWDVCSIINSHLTYVEIISEKVTAYG